MTFTLTIEMDNAAFIDESAPDGEGNDSVARTAEVARILRRVASRADDLEPGDRGAVFDVNGNTVGEWEVV